MEKLKIEHFSETKGFYFKINGMGISIDFYSSGSRALKYESAKKIAIKIYNMEKKNA